MYCTVIVGDASETIHWVLVFEERPLSGPVVGRGEEDRENRVE